jgi:hypothetical protein
MIDDKLGTRRQLMCPSVPLSRDYNTVETKGEKKEKKKRWSIYEYIAITYRPIGNLSRIFGGRYCRRYQVSFGVRSAEEGERGEGRGERIRMNPEGEGEGEEDEKGDCG